MFTIIKKQFYAIKTRQESGQSLVEMAIITPLLLFLLLGVFEVGSAVRSYLTLVNVNREITRFAVRPGYLNFTDVNTIDDSYLTVRNWVDVSLGEQLNLDFRDTGNINNTGNATLIISHVVVDTGFPCEDMNNCNCDAFANPNYNPYPDDDIIVHPDKPGMWYQAKRYGPAETVTGQRTSRIDYEALVTQELIPQNNKFNCELIKKGGVASANNIVITELFVDQPQLFGFPFISNPFTDPVSLYSHTTMRLVSGARDLLNNIDTVGPVCMAYPITFGEDIFDYPDNPSVPQWIDAFEGSSPGNFGWLTWNPDPSNNNAGYVEKELKIPQLSMNDFTDVLEPDDHSLSIGDAVSTKPGIGNSSGVDAQLQLLVGKEIIIPVYEDNPGNGQNAYYIISHFAKIKVDEICLPRNNNKCDGKNQKQIKATFLGYVDEHCGSDAPSVTPTPSSNGNNSPLAGDDEVITLENTPVTISPLTNDSDPDGDELIITSVTEVSTPFKGTLQISADGKTITYQPKNNDTGTYVFEYTISDGYGGTAMAYITVQVVTIMPTSTPVTSSTPTTPATNTPLPAGNTPTPTSTSVSATPTSTPPPTNTPAPTNTPVPPPTNTPVPPSPTPTVVSVSTALPWVERFDLSDGTTSDNGSTAWSTDKKGAGGDFDVNDKEFEISNTQRSPGGNSPLWVSEEIDINGVNDVEISIDVKSTGDMESSGGGHDYLYIYYTIDGQSYILKKYDGGIPGNGFKTLSQKNLSGQTLQFVIFGSTSSNSESYFIDNIVVNGESTPPTPITYQAEEANMGGGVTVESNHSGYNGSGFVNFPGSGGYVEFQNVDGGSGGSRTLVFRFALGSSARTGSLIVNGNSQNITFQPTGAWDGWSTMNVTVNLNSGAGNTIRLESTGQDLANLDQITVN